MDNHERLFAMGKAAHDAGEPWSEFWAKVHDMPEVVGLYEQLLNLCLSGDTDGLRPVDPDGTGKVAIDDAGLTIAPSDTHTEARLQLTFPHTPPISTR